MNKIARRAAVVSLLNRWIENEDPTVMGQLICTRSSFSNLYAEVTELRNMSKSPKWIAGVDKWLEIVQQAYDIFCDNAGFDKAERIWIANSHDFTMFSLKEHIRLVKWAVWQGLVYVPEI